MAGRERRSGGGLLCGVGLRREEGWGKDAEISCVVCRAFMDSQRRCCREKIDGVVCFECDGCGVFVEWLYLDAGAPKPDVSGANQSVCGTMSGATADGGRRLAEYGVRLCATLL